MLSECGQVNYCLPCLQTKLQVWWGASSEVGGKHKIEEMRNFKSVKALGAQGSLMSGRRKQHVKRGGGWR